MYECDEPIDVFDGLFINEEFVDIQRRDRFIVGQCDLHFAAMAVKREWPRVTPNFHVAVRLGKRKISDYLCTISLFEGRFYHRLLHVKRPPDFGHLPLAIEFDRHFCLERPETMQPDMHPKIKHARSGLGQIMCGKPR